ncbi:MAG: hypothetical protein LBG15_04560 [Dysgonamonadaceae bacterium]|jgi:hypothetical protein|nr:hypothetical protein [Dysgonamonadaceae bacterium]
MITLSPEKKIEKKLEVHMAEFNAVNDGIARLISFQEKIIWYHILIGVAVIAFTAQTKEFNDYLFLIIVTSFLAMGILYISLNTTMATHADYIIKVLKPKIEELLNTTHENIDKTDITKNNVYLAWNEYINKWWTSNRFIIKWINSLDVCFLPIILIVIITYKNYWDIVCKCKDLPFFVLYFFNIALCVIVYVFRVISAVRFLKLNQK